MSIALLIQQLVARIGGHAMLGSWHLISGTDIVPTSEFVKTLYLAHSLPGVIWKIGHAVVLRCVCHAGIALRCCVAATTGLTDL